MPKPKPKTAPTAPSIKVQDLAILAGKPHRESLIEWAAGASKVRVFVSFLFPEGVALIRKLLQKAPVDLTVSTYMRSTRKQALQELHDMLEGEKPGANALRVRVATGDKDGFHGKVYRYAYGDGTARIVVGSANLSGGGLDGRGEVSLTVAGPAKTIPNLVGKDFPAILDSRWATARDPSPLLSIIATYRESKAGSKLGEEVSSDMYSFIDVTRANDAETAAAENVTLAKPDELEEALDGAGDDSDMSMVIYPPSQTAWTRMGHQMEIGEVILLGWKGKSFLKAYRLVRRYEGVVSPLRASRLFLYLKEIPASKLAREKLPWKNRAVAREELPAGLLARIDAAPLHSDQAL